MGDWDVVIVGAGYGGLCTGALLARAGKRVLVLERDATIGGRAKSFRYAGQVLDDGAHMISQAGHLEAVFADLALELPELITMTKSQIYHEDRWKEPRELFTPEMYKKVFSVMMSLSPEEVSRLDDVPLKSWVEGISNDPGIRMLFFYLGCATSVGNRFETYSTGEMLYILREIVQSGRKLSQLGAVIAGGSNSILAPLADYINSHRGEVRLNTPVDSVEIDQGRAAGVNVEVGERLFHSQVMDVETLKADFVIVTLPLWDLFNVLDESLFPRWWVDWVNWISGKVSHAWSIIYALDEPLFDMDAFRWAPNLPESGFSGVFFPMPTYGDDVGQFQFHVSYQGHYDEMPNLFERNRASVKRRIRDTIRMLERESVQLFPQLKGLHHWRVAHAGVYGLAQSPGFVGSKRPSMKTPEIDNLFIVSNTVQEARGVSTQGVGKCARMAAEAILDASHT
jgi:phytoene dehydrogenase-like protein